MTHTTDDRRIDEELLLGRALCAEKHQLDQRLARIAQALGISVSRLTEDIPADSQDLLDQCALMNSLFPLIRSAATRSLLIAAAREAVRESGSGC